MGMTGRRVAAKVMALGLLAAGIASWAAGETVDVAELSARDAAERMAAGTLTSQQLTAGYLARIAALDDAGPELGAVLALNPSALADAAALDAERAAGHVRGPLHGLPVLVKDNIDVAGMVSSAGSLALAAHRPESDAFLVARLRAAGAVILGKTNLSEWANFRSTRATSGWSSLGGQTKNPHALDRNPCGSSSGTGAAIAASFAAIGIGTETDGSIICPSSVNGIVGLKPTVGLVSRSGIIPISASQDTAGPMGRSVEDVALLLSAMTGVDPSDAASADGKGRARADYGAGLSAATLAGKRIGVLRATMGFHPDVDAAMQRAIETLRAGGATVVDATVTTAGRWDSAEFEVLLYEFKDGINRYLSGVRQGPRSLDELIAWNAAHASEAMPYFGQEIFEMAAAKGPLTTPEYRRARLMARRLAGEQGLLAALDAQRLDALMAPSASPAWTTDLVLGDHFLGAGYGAAAVAGTPSLTVPCGESHGLPLGVTFMGRAWSEADLLALGAAYERASQARRPPTFRPGVP